MASVKRSARSVKVKTEKLDTSSDGVLEMSVTVGYLGSDCHKEEIAKQERLLLDHCVAGVVALERGDVEQHLHFQMVCRAKVSSARAFGILVRKYLDWFGKRNMNPAGKVTCKVLTNRLLHTWKGMVGYCLKDSGLTHFEVVMHNVSDEEVIVGKTLHTIYGKADLKARVLLTHKNIGERAYVWFKYKENRQLTATMLSTLTDMVNSGLFLPAASWIIPHVGLGMEQRRMNAFWRCMTDPKNVDRADIADIFIRKREYVKGHYLDDDPVPSAPTGEEYVYEGSPPSANTKDNSPASGVRSFPRSISVPPLSGSQPNMKVQTVAAKNVGPRSKRKLFVDVPYDGPTETAVHIGHPSADFVPLKPIALLPVNTFLPTVDALDPFSKKQRLTKAEFWDSIADNSLKVPISGVPGSSEDIHAEQETNVPWTNPEGDWLEHLNEKDVIVLSSDSESDGETSACKKKGPSCNAEASSISVGSKFWPLRAATVVEDRCGGKSTSVVPPVYVRCEDHVDFVLRKDPPCDTRRCDDPPYQCRGKC